MTGVLISLAQIWHINKVAAGTLTDIVVGRRATKYSSTGKHSCGLHTRKNTAELGKYHTHIAFARTTEYCEVQKSEESTEVRGVQKTKAKEKSGLSLKRDTFMSRYAFTRRRIHDLARTV